MFIRYIGKIKNTELIFQKNFILMLFLSGCVPNLQLDLFSFDVDHSGIINFSFYFH